MFLHNLPPEVLIQIFAEISVKDRLETSLVSRFYHQVISDDHGWRLAFLKRFKALPLVRMGLNFREEYLSRLDLMAWGKQPVNQVTIPTPATDPSAMYLYSKQTLLLGSINDGFVTQLDPLTGKRGRDDLWVSDDGQSQMTSCLLIEGSRAWFGLLNGSVVSSYYSKGKWQDWKELRLPSEIIITKFKRIKDCNLLFLGTSDGSLELMDWANGELLRTFRGGLTSKVDFVEYSNKFVVYAGSSTLLIHFYNVYNRHDTVREPAQINMDSPFRGIWLDDTHSSIICWNVNSISKIMLTTNENGHIQTQVSYSNFTAVSYCESAVSVLCAGDEAGAIHLWKLTAKKSEVLTQIFHHSSPISCLSFTPAALLSASCDGDINMFDGISLSLLRSLNRKRRTPHLDADRWKVDFLLFQSGCVIAGQRDSISSFVKRALKRIASTPKSKKVRVSFGRASGQSSSREKEEVNYEVAQVMDELESQRRDRQMAMNLVEKTNGSMQIHGMSENELIEYAKVLSVQDSHSAVCDTDQSQIDLALTLSISLKQDQ